MESYLTIREILRRKHFESIEVIAGGEGLNKQVKWVHVVEVIQIKKLLNGYELILTTGLGWKKDKHLFMSLIEQLIESNASGLCLEMGTNTSSVPPEIIQKANQHKFPIIIFNKEVPFVEITQDIHSLLINRQYKMISDLESYSQQLNKKLLEINDYEDILKFLQKYLDLQIIVQFNENERMFFPDLPEEKKKKITDILKGNATSSSLQLAEQTVQILGNKYAELMVISETREITDYDYLLLDRTSTALAQHFLRNLFIEEKKRMEENEWMVDWLDGRHTEQDIIDFISYHQSDIRVHGGIVCVCKFHSSFKAKNMDLTYFKLLFRTAFEQHGFYIYTAEIRNQLIFILVNQRSLPNWKERMQKGFSKIKTDRSGKLNVNSISFGVGKFVNKLNEIDKSYLTAKETLFIQKNLPEGSKSYYYDELQLYRIITLMNKHTDLNEMMMESLKPVIEYDKKYNGALLETLKAYLACNGSKQETAKKLFIVRQTLYHRIDKLEKLLGENFMQPENRIILELMTVAYDYLIKKKEKQNHATQ